MEPGIIRPFPNRLRLHRKLWRLKQCEVAKLLGLANANPISQWEKGYKFPSTQHLIDLSNLYRTYPNELYGECFQESLQRIRAAEKALFNQE